jgi:hypothetical protein
LVNPQDPRIAEVIDEPGGDGR